MKSWLALLYHLELPYAAPSEQCASIGYLKIRFVGKPDRFRQNTNFVVGTRLYDLEWSTFMNGLYIKSIVPSAQSAIFTKSVSSLFAVSSAKVMLIHIRMIGDEGAVS
jgi:hypothetical protein